MCVVLAFAARDVDLAALHARGHRAPRARHARLGRAPDVELAVSGSAKQLLGGLGEGVGLQHRATAQPT